MANPADPAAAMPLFSGEFRSTLDQKNRLTVPARWRPEGELKELFLVHNPKRGCITALPKEGFQRMDAEARAKASSPAVHRMFISQFYSKAAHCPVDSQGRVILSEELRQAGRIDREVTLTGSSDRFELWSPAAWRECCEAEAAIYEQMTQEIGL